MMILNTKMEQRELRFLNAINQAVHFSELIDNVFVGEYLNAIYFGKNQDQLGTLFIESMKQNGFEIEFFGFDDKIVWFKEVQ